MKEGLSLPSGLWRKIPIQDNHRKANTESKGNSKFSQSVLVKYDHETGNVLGKIGIQSAMTSEDEKEDKNLDNFLFQLKSLGLSIEQKQQQSEQIKSESSENFKALQIGVEEHYFDDLGEFSKQISRCFSQKINRHSITQQLKKLKDEYEKLRKSIFQIIKSFQLWIGSTLLDQMGKNLEIFIRQQQSHGPIPQNEAKNLRITNLQSRIQELSQKLDFKDAIINKYATDSKKIEQQNENLSELNFSLNQQIIQQDLIMQQKLEANSESSKIIIQNLVESAVKNQSLILKYRREYQELARQFERHSLEWDNEKKRLMRMVEGERGLREREMSLKIWEDSLREKQLDFEGEVEKFYEKKEKVTKIEKELKTKREELNIVEKQLTVAYSMKQQMKKESEELQQQIFHLDLDSIGRRKTEQQRIFESLVKENQSKVRWEDEIIGSRYDRPFSNKFVHKGKCEGLQYLNRDKTLKKMENLKTKPKSVKVETYSNARPSSKFNELEKKLELLRQDINTEIKTIKKQYF